MIWVVSSVEWRAINQVRSVLAGREGFADRVKSMHGAHRNGPALSVKNNVVLARAETLANPTAIVVVECDVLASMRSDPSHANPTSQ
jgi:hypothetical protein